MVQQSWQPLRTDPGPGDTREDVGALGDHLAESTESTPLALGNGSSATVRTDLPGTGGPMESGHGTGSGTFGTTFATSC
ncbi:hypothetical protein ACFWVP_03115 [Streptomyces sp. NPDC058637]|uniref:hypothetical protein n=1 Tax=Streptomyces sp. NPDC058637 TaxID=3346569 RepID=UPI0036467B93